MANIKIAQLTNQINIADTDLILIESATSTNKMTVGKLKELLGIQAGGVVESGSNANGRYTKFADGTIICYGKVTFYNVDANTRKTESWVYPHIIEFGVVETYISLSSFTDAFEFNLNYLTLSHTTPNAATANLSILNSTVTQTYIASVVAVGRWKL